MAEAKFKIYDADQVTANFAGIPLDSGLADGEFIKVEYQDDDFETHVGTDGTVTRSKKGNKTAKITVILASSSETNAALSAIRNLDISQPNGAGVGPFYIRDRGGLSVLRASKSWISKMPDESKDRSVTNIEWPFMAVIDQHIIGGN